MSNNTPVLPPAHNLDMTAVAAILQEIRTGVGNYQVLHERQRNSEQRMLESEDRTASALNEIKHSLGRVVDRIEGISAGVRQEVSSVREDFRLFSEAHRQETADQIRAATAPIWKRLDETSAATAEVKGELSSWINRFKGGFFIGALCAGVFQSCIVAAMLWMVDEVKTTHDWRIQVEAERRADARHERRPQAGGQPN